MALLELAKNLFKQDGYSNQPEIKIPQGKAIVATEQGGRDYNQDRAKVYPTKKGVVLVLADGMGGMGAKNSGEVAAQTFVDQMGIMAEEPTLETNFQETFIRHRQISLNEMAKKNVGEGGNTQVVISVEGNNAYFTWEGDSRAYLIKVNGTVQMLTQDHKAGDGRLTKAMSPSPNYISYPEFGITQLEKGDQLLLCTDGVYNHFNEQAFQQLMKGKTQKEIIEGIGRTIKPKVNDNSDNYTTLIYTHEQENLPVGQYPVQMDVKPQVGPTPEIIVEDQNLTILRGYDTALGTKLAILEIFKNNIQLPVGDPLLQTQEYREMFDQVHAGKKVDDLRQEIYQLRLDLDQYIRTKNPISINPEKILNAALLIQTENNKGGQKFLLEPESKESLIMREIVNRRLKGGESLNTIITSETNKKVESDMKAIIAMTNKLKVIEMIEQGINIPPNSLDNFYLTGINNLIGEGVSLQQQKQKAQELLMRLQGGSGINQKQEQIKPKGPFDIGSKVNVKSSQGKLRQGWEIRYKDKDGEYYLEGLDDDGDKAGRSYSILELWEANGVDPLMQDPKVVIDHYPPEVAKHAIFTVTRGTEINRKDKIETELNTYFNKLVNQGRITKEQLDVLVKSLLG